MDKIQKYLYDKRLCNLNKIIEVLKNNDKESIIKIIKTLDDSLKELNLEEITIRLEQTVDFTDYVSICAKYDDVHVFIVIGNIDRDFHIKDGKTVFSYGKYYMMIGGSSEEILSFNSGLIIGIVNVVFTNTDIPYILSLPLEEDTELYEELNTPLQ